MLWILPPPIWDQLLDTVLDLAASCTHGRLVYNPRMPLLSDNNKRDKVKEREKRKAKI